MDVRVDLNEYCSFSSLECHTVKCAMQKNDCLHLSAMLDICTVDGGNDCQ